MKYKRVKECTDIMTKEEFLKLDYGYQVKLVANACATKYIN